MVRPRRLLLAALLAVWIATLLACGGVGGEATSTQKDIEQASTKETKEDKAATNPWTNAARIPAKVPTTKPPVTKPPSTKPSVTKAPVAKPPVKGAEKPDLWNGTLGVGASAYDQVPQPWRDQFVKEWKDRVRTHESAVEEANGGLRAATAAFTDAEKAIGEFKTRYKDQLTDEYTKPVYEKKKKALTALEDAVKKATDAFDASNAALRKVVKNDPPYFAGYFSDCMNMLDVEQHVTKLEVRKKEEELRRKEEEAKRKAEEELDVDGLVLLTKTVQARGNRLGGEITGTVVNRTGKKLRYAEIRYILYDDSNAQIGTAFANITDLEAGARWNFKAIALKDFNSYKITALSGR